MDKNDPLSEYNNIPVGHNHTYGVVYSKVNFNVEICSAFQIYENHLTLHIPRANSTSSLILLNPNNHYNHGFHNIFDYNHCICSDYLPCTVTASGSHYTLMSICDIIATMNIKGL